MRLAVLHCFAGISGDMFLGALLDAGVPLHVLERAVAALGVDAALAVETVDRSGISATKVHVLEHGRLAEDAPHEPGHGFTVAATPRDEQHREVQHERTMSRQPETQHQHKAGHAHEHGAQHRHDHAHAPPDAHAGEQSSEGGQASGHEHARSLSEIRKLIGAAALEDAVKGFAIRTFELLGAAEAKVHNVPVETIHFHEVGAVDAIADVVAASAGIHHLGVDTWHCSAINLGGGMVRCAHGLFPVPAPATVELLRGMPTYSAHIEQELVTPTGAALLRALGPSFEPPPIARVDAIGYGAGTRNPNGFPNVLRLSVAEVAGSAAAAAPPVSHAAMSGEGSAHVAYGRETQTVTVLETALDDLSPQVTAYVAEQARLAGALDVMLTQVVMKKGRPGTLVTVLCRPESGNELEELLLRETSTLGVRRRQEQRACLERRHVTVETAYGPIRIKVGVENGAERNAAPEFEDCRAAAEQHAAALKQVQAAAMAAFLRQAKS